MDWSVFWTAAAAIATFLAVLVALGLGVRGDRRSLQARYDNARPVLRIVSGPQVIPVQQGNEMYLKWDAPLPSIEVRNVGNGPAFNVRSVIYESEAIAVPDQLSSLGPSWKHMSDTKENHWYHWTTDAVSQGESIELQYAFPSKLFRNNIFSEANKFIESKHHKQKYAFNAPKQPLSQPTLKDPTHVCRVVITYHDIFQRKHASIYDLVFRQRWEVIAFIDDIVKDLGDLVE
jgi:hypothetical protein